MVGLFVVGSVWARDHNPGLLLAVTIAIAGLFTGGHGCWDSRGDRRPHCHGGGYLAFCGCGVYLHMLHPIFSVAFAGAAGDSVRMHRRYIKAITTGRFGRSKPVNLRRPGG